MKPIQIIKHPAAKPRTLGPQINAEDAPTTMTPATDSDETDLETPPETAKEVGGPKGPEPTRYGGWERKGRCVDF